MFVQICSYTFAAQINKMYNINFFTIMAFNPIDLIGPGTIKMGLKGLEKLGVGEFGSAISEIDRFSHSAAWNKHRVDNMEEKIQDFWDEHKESVGEFWEDVEETISEGWNTIADNTEEVLTGFGGLLESLFD